jgi:hypothetical protein
MRKILFVALLFIGCGVDPTFPVIEGDKILSERPENYPGFFTYQWGTTDYRKELPDLDYQPNEEVAGVFTITPVLGSWDDVPFDDPDIWLFRIMPGNYVEWGELPPIVNNGEEGRRRVLRYYDPLLGYEIPNPEYLREEDQVILENFTLGKPGREKTPVKHWILYGLTFKGKLFSKGDDQGGDRCRIMPGSEDCNIVNCYFYKSRGLRMYGNCHAFQFNHVRGKIKAPGDVGGIGLYTTETGSYDCRIVHNIISDQTDGIGLPKDGDGSGLFGDIAGTVIAGNKIYATEDVRLLIDGVEMNCMEDGIDVKNGSYDPENPVLITENLIMYQRPAYKPCGGTGGAGKGINIQYDAQNLIVKGNIIFDCAVGIDVLPGKDPFTVDNIAIFNNAIVDTKPVGGDKPEATGYAIRMTAPGFVGYNTIIGGRDGIITDNGKRQIFIIGNRIANIENPVEWKTEKNRTAAFNVYDDKTLLPYQVVKQGDTLNFNLIPDSTQLQTIKEIYTEDFDLTSQWFSIHL